MRPSHSATQLAYSYPQKFLQSVWRRTSFSSRMSIGERRHDSRAGGFLLRDFFMGPNITRKRNSEVPQQPKRFICHAAADRPRKYRWIPCDHHVHAAGCRTNQIPPRRTTELTWCAKKKKNSMREIELAQYYLGTWLLLPKQFSAQDLPSRSLDRLMHYDLDSFRCPIEPRGHLVVARRRIQIIPLRPVDSGPPGISPFCVGEIPRILRAGRTLALDFAVKSR